MFAVIHSNCDNTECEKSFK